MKFTINRGALNEAIQRVAKAVSPRTTLPILSGIKFVVTGESITLTATDTIQSIQSSIVLDTETARVGTVEVPGSAVIPAKFLIEITKKLPKEEVVFEDEGSGLIRIVSGKTNIDVAVTDAEEFPLLPAINHNASIEVQSDKLREMIESTTFAASTDEKSPVLTGALVTLRDGALKLLATDRHRLASAYTEIETEMQYSNIVIPAKHLNDLAKVLPDKSNPVRMAVADGWALFQFDGVLFYSRLVDGTYPDTSKIIPQDFKTEVEVATQTLQESIDRAYLISREEKTNIVRLEIHEDGSAVISSAASQLGKVSEELQVDIEGEPIKVAFNSKFMLDALKVIDTKDVFIGFTGAMSPIIIKPVGGADVLHLILPYRTTN